jgi:hypothetical protein
MKNRNTITTIGKVVCYTIIGVMGVIIIVDTLTNGANI